MEGSINVITATTLLAATSIICYSAGVYNTSNTKPTKQAKKSIKNKINVVEDKMKQSGKGRPPTSSLGTLDIRRKWQIASGGPTDHAGEVVIVPLDGFDLNRTIFGSVEGSLPRTVVKSKLAVELYWNDMCIERVQKSYEMVPKPPSYKSDLITFMETDCNFAMEHADGSFMDHLKFCHDYSAYNYPSESPIPLFLHSIMGVGTNFFPMDKAMVPKLKQLVTKEDFIQIEAFPSILRLLTGTDLLAVLSSNADKLKTLKSIEFHLVIDNSQVIILEGGAFIKQLNFHLIHLLDFLPCASWKNQMDDGFMQTFSKLHALLSKSNTLKCNVNFNLSSGELSDDGIPVTIGSIVRGLLPMALKLKLNEKAVKKFSAKIGHSLEYKLNW